MRTPFAVETVRLEWGKLVAFQPVPNTAQVALTFRGVVAGPLDGSLAQFSFYVQDPINGWPLAGLIALVTYTDTWVATQAIPLLSVDWAYRGCVARDLSSSTGAQSSSSGITQGTRAGDSLPPMTCALTQYTGDAGGFPRRGRIFTPFGAESDSDGAAWTNAFVTAVDNAMTAYRTGLPAVDPDWRQVLVSRSSGSHVWGTDPDDPPLPTLPDKRATAVTNTIGNITVAQVQGVQRRRRPAPF